MALAPPLGHGGHRLRNDEEHSGHREGRHPSLHRAARSGEAHLFVDHRRLRLRRTKGPLHLSCGRDLAPSGPRPQGRVREVRCEGFRLQCLSAQERGCTESPKGRWVSRSLEEEYLERVRAYRDTEPYRARP
jgi:hypothetical protein